LISDLHLDAERPQLTEILVRFLQGPAREAAALYLLGDVFEVWIGDDDTSALIDTVASELAAVARGGTHVYFMHGNRDFLVGEVFARRAGATLITDPHVVHLGGIRTLLTHGDRYCTHETAYQAFRQQSRDPEWQAAVLAKPLEERRALGKGMRAQSVIAQQARLNAGYGLVDVDNAAALAEMEALDAWRIIHGHTHQPAVHHLTSASGRTGERIVLADWRDTGECLVIQDDGTLCRESLH